MVFDEGGGAYGSDEIEKAFDFVAEDHGAKYNIRFLALTYFCFYSFWKFLFSTNLWELKKCACVCLHAHVEVLFQR